MPAKVDYTTYGKQYGKPDLERLGIFVEMPYMNGTKYVTPFPKNYPPKGRNIIGEGRKTKCGTQHGYFDEEFMRLFEGEAIVRSKDKGKKKKGKALTPFMPAGDSKWHSTPGDYYGCFSGNIEAFGNVRRPKPKYVKQAANFLTNPVKKGGPGYPDICLSKYPEHIADPYRAKIKLTKKQMKEAAKAKGHPMITVHYPHPYFDINPYLDPTGKLGPTYVRPREFKGKHPPRYTIFVPTGPAKWQGGSHAGCFDPFPEWKTDRKPPTAAKKKKTFGGHFYPQSMALKTMQTFSVLNLNTDLRVNAKNFNTYEPSYTEHLLD